MTETWKFKHLVVFLKKTHVYAAKPIYIIEGSIKWIKKRTFKQLQIKKLTCSGLWIISNIFFHFFFYWIFHILSTLLRTGSRCVGWNSNLWLYELDAAGPFKIILNNFLPTFRGFHVFRFDILPPHHHHGWRAWLNSNNAFCLILF